MSRTLIIDDCLNGGSDAGAWATHIVHTPALAAQERAQRTPGSDASSHPERAPLGGFKRLQRMMGAAR